MAATFLRCTSWLKYWIVLIPVTVTVLWMYLVITQKTYHKRLLRSVDFLVKKALTEACGYGY